MFEKFTKPARFAVIDAAQIAQGSGNKRVDSRHLLLALIRSEAKVRAALTAVGAEVDAVDKHLTAGIENSELDAEALAAIGIDLSVVQQRVNEQFGENAWEAAGADKRSKKQPRFSADAKDALKAGLSESMKHEGREIETRHLALGILGVTGPGADSLEEAGIDVRALRQQLAGR